jgi:hypothetical protein
MRRNSAGALPMTPQTRFTAADIKKLVKALQDHRLDRPKYFLPYELLSSAENMLRQAVADAERVEKFAAFRAWLTETIDNVPLDNHEDSMEIEEAYRYVLAEFDRLLAERGGEEG